MNVNKSRKYTGIDILEAMAHAKNYNAHLLNLIIHGQNNSREFIDYGTGSGTFAQLLTDKGCSVRCIEPDATLAAQLADKGFSVSYSINQINDVEYLYSLNVLEHIEDDFAALSKIFDHLKVGGKIFVYVPAFMVLYSAMDKKVGHFRRYSKKQIIDLHEGAGFTVDDARYVDSLGFFVTLLYKWFGNDRGDINPRSLKIYDSYIFPVSRVFDLLFSSFFGKNVMIRAHKE